LAAAMNNGCTDYKPLRKLRRGEGPRCGTCRLWMANLKSRTNARPLLRGEEPCQGDGNWEQPDLKAEAEAEASMPCGGDAWESAYQIEADSRPPVATVTVVNELAEPVQCCGTCGKSVANGGKCGLAEVRDGE